MIRAFIATWQLIPERMEVINPIAEYIGTANSPVSRVSMYYPDTDGNGLPDKNRVLVLVEGPPEIEQLVALQGVKMLPAYRFGKPISDIPSPVKTAVLNTLEAEGIPRAAMAGVEVYGDFIRKVAQYFSPAFKSFGPYESSRDEEFGP